MTVGSAVIAAMKAAKFSQKRAGELLGRGQNSISAMLAKEDSTRICAMLQILDVIGYEMVIRPIRPGRREDNCFVVSMEDEESKVIGVENASGWVEKEKNRLGEWSDGFELGREENNGIVYLVLKSYVKTSRRNVTVPMGGKAYVMICTSKTDAKLKGADLVRELKKECDITMVV